MCILAQFTTVAPVPLLTVYSICPTEKVIILQGRPFLGCPKLDGEAKMHGLSLFYFRAIYIH